MEKPPDKIFLQWDSGEFDATWCIDKINDNDIPYIRKSIVAACERENAELKQHIAALESQLPRWISVEERLPDASERVQAVLGFNIKTRCTEARLYFDDTKFDGWAVTHWMTLPLPPEGE